MKCTVPDCPEYAAGDSNLCPAHLDLDCLVEFTISRKEEPTVESVTGHFHMARSHSSLWVITDDQISAMLPAYLETKKEPAILTTKIAGQLITAKAVNQ